MNKKSVKAQANLTPFVDLFSILAIGILILMTITSGTSTPSHSKPAITQVRFYMSLNKDYKNMNGNHPIGDLLIIRPIFFVDGIESSPESVGIKSILKAYPNYWTLMIRGNHENLSIKFRVERILEPSILGEKGSYKIIDINNTERNPNEDKFTMGMWSNPSFCLSGCD